MGDMADYYIGLALSNGENPFGGYGRARRTPTVYGPPLKCKHCGATTVYWQRVRGDYKIFDKATLDTHVCRNTAEGFEECKI